MSSRYTRANCHLTMVSIVSIALWYIAGAFLSPRGIRVNVYVPKCKENVVFSMSIGAIVICQYPELASRVLKIRASSRLSMCSFILGTEYAFRIVMALRCRSTRLRLCISACARQFSCSAQRHSCSSFLSLCPIMFTYFYYNLQLIYALAVQ